jgi:TRAP-type C4-dicarboxylate transport system permease small subunit
MGFMERVENVVLRISAVTSGAGMILLGLVGIVLAAGVVVRYFGHALSGSYDLVQILIVVAVAFAFVECELKNRHARAEVVVDRVPPGMRAWFESLTTLCSLFYWGVLVYSGLQLALRKWAEQEETDMLKVPIAPFRGAWLFGLVLMCVIVLSRLIQHVKKGISK